MFPFKHVYEKRGWWETQKWINNLRQDVCGPVHLFMKIFVHVRITKGGSFASLLDSAHHHWWSNLAEKSNLNLKKKSLECPKSKIVAMSHLWLPSTWKVAIPSCHVMCSKYKQHTTLGRLGLKKSKISKILICIACWNHQILGVLDWN